MTATEELRRMLDERGVEWRGGLPTETMVEADGLDLLYVALPDGRVRAFIRNYLTPEQAIEATLGGDLQAENMKLRELVRDMCKAFIHGPCYRWCEHMPEPCNGDKCQYVRRMHELGVDA